MDVLVVGGTGLLGSAVVDRTGGTGVSRRTGFDFFDDDADEVVTGYDPDAVVVAATVERQSIPIREYVDAVGSFVDACAGRRLVYVSSDAVFDGEAGQYEPGDVRTPKDAYGRRLQMFEDQVERHDDGVVLRPSYVYAGDQLSPRLADARDALADGVYERYDDVYRSPAHADDVAAAVAELASGDWNGVFHVPGPRLSVYEFHDRALSALGVDTSDLEPVAAPEDASVGRDRSLEGPRFEAELDATIRAPEDAF